MAVPDTPGLMRRVLRWLPMLLVPVVFSACASTQSNEEGPRSSVNVLTNNDISGYTNAYEAVSSLRSRWLRPRGTDSFRSPGQVLVYLDNARLGSVASLATLRVDGIAYIEYIDGMTATARWGLDHGHGVIHVSTHGE